MNKSEESHNYPTLRMCYYGYVENGARGQGRLSLPEFYLRCAGDDEFKANYAPFLDLEHVGDEELQQVVSR